jgi:hypothetical protein
MKYSDKHEWTYMSEEKFGKIDLQYYEIAAPSLFVLQGFITCEAKLHCFHSNCITLSNIYVTGILKTKIIYV